MFIVLFYLNKKYLIFTLDDGSSEPKARVTYFKNLNEIVFYLRIFKFFLWYLLYFKTHIMNLVFNQNIKSYDFHSILCFIWGISFLITFIPIWSINGHHLRSFFKVSRCESNSYKSRRMSYLEVNQMADCNKYILSNSQNFE